MGRHLNASHSWWQFFADLLASIHKAILVCIPIPDDDLLGRESVPDTVYLRVENKTENPISVYWLSHTGDETLYFHLSPSCSISQQTYKGNVWLIKDKDSGRLFIRCQVTDRKRQLCCVQPSTIANLEGHDPALVNRPTEPDEAIPSCYTQRVDTCLGIPVVGFPEVSMIALQSAGEIIENMLKGCPRNLLLQLRAYGCKVAIIGRRQVTTDILEHSYLRGSSVADGRNWDREVRGLGGTKVAPTCSAGEENVLRCPDDSYCKESILVHEMAHTLMEVAFTEELYDRVLSCYQRSKAKYTPGIYMVADEKEYWAEGSESWFNASLREDLNDGFNSREKLQGHDPELAALLGEVYGDGEWRYNFRPILEDKVKNL